MLALESATIEDLAEAMSWSGDEASLQLWAGPLLTRGMSIEAAWRAVTPQPRLTFAARTSDDRLSALGQIVFKEAHWAHLARIVVAPHLRGHGLGRSMCLALMQRARALDPALIGWTLYVYPHNHAAKSLYESLGFSIGGAGEDGDLRMIKLR